MTRYTKDSHGHYHIHGKKYEMLEGSRAQVYHGTAYKTSGGLKKPEILMNKNGRIVSKKKHTTAKKEKRLVKAGYGTKKGKFGFVKIGQSKKMRGGKMGALSPMDLGADVPTSHYGAVGGSRRRRKGGQSYGHPFHNMMGGAIPGSHMMGAGPNPRPPMPQHALNTTHMSGDHGAGTRK
jgi:hypothetical protein